MQAAENITVQVQWETCVTVRTPLEEPVPSQPHDSPLQSQNSPMPPRNLLQKKDHMRAANGIVYMTVIAHYKITVVHLELKVATLIKNKYRAAIPAHSTQYVQTNRHAAELLLLNKDRS